MVLVDGVVVTLDRCMRKAWGITRINTINDLFSCFVRLGAAVLNDYLIGTAAWRR